MESTKTIDLENRIEDIEDELAEIEEDQEEIMDEALEAEKMGNDIDQDLEDEFDDLESERVELEGERKTLQGAVDEWDGSQFEITELTFGQVQRISDEVLEESFEIDMQRQDMTGAPKEGYYQIAILREAIQQEPPGAPSDPADLPTSIGEFLFERINAFNTVGDTEMGNSSLKEKMKEYKDSTQNSSTEE